MAWTAKEALKPSKPLQGISQKQIDEHFNVLYKGYVNKMNEIEAKILEANLGEANGTFSLIRELEKEKVFAANAVRLHELYFGNLGGDGQPKGRALELIKRDFGSYEKWEANFKAQGLCARGWVVLANDFEDMKLRTWLSDIHFEAPWSCAPLLVLDVYEHAYFIDYATGRKAYVEAFMKNINWDVVNQRVEMALGPVPAAAKK